jgi:WD40 repeat protein
LADNQGEVRAVAFTPDGRTPAAAGPNRIILLWDPATGYQLLPLSGHQAPIDAIAFAPDGKALAAAAPDGASRLWQAAADGE